ncbi:MAG: amidohydrolase family protein [Acidobacteriota bacterium]
MHDHVKLAGLALLVTGFALPLAAAGVSPASASVEIAVHCGSLLDTASGAMRAESTIIVAADRVKEVLVGSPDRAAIERAAKADGATVRYVDLAGLTCLPGLIDAHTHLTIQFSRTAYTDQFRWNPADYAIRATAYARRTLLAGFTTVRDLADRNGESIALRNAVNAGIVPGPRIFTAGRPIGSTGGHADPTDGYRQDLAGDPGPEIGIIDSPEDAWKAVRQHYKDGVDLIKIMPSGGVLDESASGDNPQMTLAEIEAVVAAAHDYGFTVAAHAHGAEAIRRAVIGGVDSIEHGTFADDTDTALMKEHGTYFVPTIIAGEFVAEKAAVPGYYPPQVAAKAAAIGPRILATAGRVYRAGVKIAFGTDAGVYPHGENAKEFALMVKAGMPPLYAIQAATTHAAELLRKQGDLGVIAPGAFADVIAVNGNPLEDVTRLENVSFVMKGGAVFKMDGRPVD